MYGEEGKSRKEVKEPPHLCNTGALLELWIEMLVVPLLSTKSKPPGYEVGVKKKRKGETGMSARWVEGSGIERAV